LYRRDGLDQLPRDDVLKQLQVDIERCPRCKGDEGRRKIDINFAQKGKRIDKVLAAVTLVQ
jgi:hypothetical protein